MHLDEILMVISTMRSTRYDKKFVHLHGSNKKGRRESAVPLSVSERRYHWELSAPPKGSLGWNVPSSSGWGCSGKYPMPLMFLICRK